MAFTQQTIDFFKIQLMDKLLSAADRVIRPQIQSQTLRRAMTQVIDISNRTKGGLVIEHFWALFYHDGTRRYGPVNAKFLVYFVNEADDPRKPTPPRASQVRRLTRAEFRSGLQRNNELFNLNPAGGTMQFMVIVRNAVGGPGQVGPLPPHPFFSEGGKLFEDNVDDIVFAEFDRFVKTNAPKERLPIKFRLQS